MQNLGEKNVQAHDEFLIDDEPSFHNYKQFMRNEFQRTVSTLCEAIHTQDGESEILEDGQAFCSGERTNYNKKAGDLYPANKQMLRRQKMKWLMQSTVLSQGVSY